MTKRDRLPIWLAAAREAEVDVASSLNRTLTIDRAAQRRSVLPDVVRRQMAALAYVRRHVDPGDVRVGMTAVEALIALERADPRVASTFRKSVLRGEMGIRDLRALAAERRSPTAEIASDLDRQEVAHRFSADLSGLQLLPAHGEPAYDRSWVCAEYVGTVGKVPPIRKWAWAGIVAPSVAWSCLRGASMQDLVRCIMAASLWSDAVSVALCTPQEDEAIRDALAPAPVTDRARIWLHDLRVQSGVERLA